MYINEKNGESPIKVGVRYCGGCNPNYDRGALVKRIADGQSKYKIETAKEENKYDILLVVGGCSACCAGYESFTAERIVKIWSEKMGLEQFGMV